jgi:hypothetical protein
MAVPAFVEASTGWFRMATQGGRACGINVMAFRTARFSPQDSAGFRESAPHGKSQTGRFVNVDHGSSTRTPGERHSLGWPHIARAPDLHPRAEPSRRLHRSNFGGGPRICQPVTRTPFLSLLFSLRHSCQTHPSFSQGLSGQRSGCRYLLVHRCLVRLSPFVDHPSTIS